LGWSAAIVTSGVEDKRSTWGGELSMGKINPKRGQKSQRKGTELVNIKKHQDRYWSGTTGASWASRHLEVRGGRNHGDERGTPIRLPPNGGGGAGNPEGE